MLVAARIALQENLHRIGKVLSIRYGILLGPELLSLVPRTLSEAKRRGIRGKKEGKGCVAHLEAAGWIIQQVS